MDVFSRQIDAGLVERQLANMESLVKPSLDPAIAERIVSELAAAERPLIYAGGGVLLSRATAELADIR